MPLLRFEFEVPSYIKKNDIINLRTYVKKNDIINLRAQRTGITAVPIATC